jgi:hypothetical protein
MPLRRPALAVGSRELPDAVRAGQRQILAVLNRRGLPQRDHRKAVALGALGVDLVVVVALSIAAVATFAPRRRAVSISGATDSVSWSRAVSTAQATGSPVEVQIAACMR